MKLKGLFINIDVKKINGEIMKSNLCQKIITLIILLCINQFGIAADPIKRDLGICIIEQPKLSFAQLELVLPSAPKAKSEKESKAAIAALDAAAKKTEYMEALDEAKSAAIEVIKAENIVASTSAEKESNSSPETVAAAANASEKLESAKELARLTAEVAEAAKTESDKTNNYADELKRSFDAEVAAEIKAVEDARILANTKSIFVITAKARLKENNEEAEKLEKAAKEPNATDEVKTKATEARNAANNAAAELKLLEDNIDPEPLKFSFAAYRQKLDKYLNSCSEKMASVIRDNDEEAIVSLKAVMKDSIQNLKLNSNRIATYYTSKQHQVPEALDLQSQLTKLSLT